MMLYFRLKAMEVLVLLVGGCLILWEKDCFLRTWCFRGMRSSALNANLRELNANWLITGFFSWRIAAL